MSDSINVVQAGAESSMPAQQVPQEPISDEGLAHYADFYRRGGWKYSFWKEYWWLRRNLVKRFKLRRGMRVLEVACGAGFQTHVLNRMGLKCVGVDVCPTAIELARQRRPRWAYHCADAMGEMPVERGSFDCVFARGFSNYHYDLTTPESLATTARMLEYVNTGGVFVMSIKTDLSGRRPLGQIWHNTLDAYRCHFRSFGRPWSVDHDKGMVVCGLWKRPRNAEQGADCI